MCGSIYGCWRVRVVLGWSRYVRIVMNCGYDNEKVLGESATWIANSVNGIQLEGTLACRPNDSKSRQKFPLSVPLIPNLWMVQCRLPIDDALSPRSASRSLTCRLGTILNRRFLRRGSTFFFPYEFIKYYFWDDQNRPAQPRTGLGPPQGPKKGRSGPNPEPWTDDTRIHFLPFSGFLTGFIFLQGLALFKSWVRVNLNYYWKRQWMGMLMFLHTQPRLVRTLSVFLTVSLSKLNLDVSQGISNTSWVLQMIFFFFMH